MELRLSSQIQYDIADLMWEAKSIDEVNYIIKIFGKDALVVYNMIVATSLDENMTTDLAELILAKFKEK